MPKTYGYYLIELHFIEQDFQLGFQGRSIFVIGFVSGYVAFFEYCLRF